MSITTSPGPGTGSGTSSQRSTSGSPGSVMTTACIPSPFARLWPVSARWGGLLTLSFPGHLLDKVSAIATQCDQSGALGVEITRHLAYARRDA